MTCKRSLPLLMAASLSLAACSSNRIEPEDAGFLHDYSLLKEHQSASGQTVLSWVSPALKRGRYKQVYLAPSQFFPAVEPSAQIPQSTLFHVTGYYDLVLRSELGKHMYLAAKPGPDTLTVRPAITRITTSTQGLRLYEWLPITLVAAGVSTAAGIRDQDSEIATQLSLKDGSTGDVVAAIVSEGTGIPLDNDKQVMTADNVKEVLDGWARDLGQSYSAVAQ